MAEQDRIVAALRHAVAGDASRGPRS
jgi:hypothetical protein